MTSVLITDRQTLVAEALETLLTRAGYAARVVGRPLGAGLVTTAVERFDPDVVLVGVGEDDAPEALDVIRQLDGMGCTVIALVGSQDPVVWATCLEYGAAGVVDKSQHAEHLGTAIDEAARGGHPMPDHTREELLAVLRQTRAMERALIAPFTRLTGREGQVLAGLIDGRTASQLAHDLGVQLTTVRSHIRAALQKLGVKSQLAAVAMARRAGWPHGDPESMRASALRVIPDRRIRLDRTGSWLERAPQPHTTERGSRIG